MIPLLIAVALGGGAGHPAGNLLVVGGGPLPPEVLKRALYLAGGPSAHILVIPLASRHSMSGEHWRQKWEKAGARHVEILDTGDRSLALAEVARADLIWLGGGSQGRLMHGLEKDGLVQKIRQRFAEGATVGGTSAGASALSDLMMPPMGSAAGLGRGLGLWPNVIVDQHFLRRHRFARLLAAVLSHPDRIGVGIDEGTAVLVQGSRLEVFGKSAVLVLDPRRSGHDPARQVNPSAASVNVSVLHAGMTFRLTGEARAT